MKPRGTLYGWAYRTLMRFAHRHNWHHTVTLRPDGDTVVWCQWCGLRDVVERKQPAPGNHLEMLKASLPKIVKG